MQSRACVCEKQKPPCLPNLLAGVLYKERMNIVLRIFCFAIIGYVATSFYEYGAKKIGRAAFHTETLVLFGYRLHHSIYGLCALAFSILLFFTARLTASYVLLGLSIGILAQHSVTDGFRFLSKEKI